MKYSRLLPLFDFTYRLSYAKNGCTFYNVCHSLKIDLCEILSPFLFTLTLLMNFKVPAVAWQKTILKKAEVLSLLPLLFRSIYSFAVDQSLDEESHLLSEDDIDKVRQLLFYS